MPPKTGVYVTIAKDPTHDYPFAVVAYVAGKASYETTCRSKRDALLVGNGVIMGMMHLQNQHWETLRPTMEDLNHNVVFDPRIVD